MVNMMELKIFIKYPLHLYEEQKNLMMTKFHYTTLGKITRCSHFLAVLVPYSVRDSKMEEITPVNTMSNEAVAVRC